MILDRQTTGWCNGSVHVANINFFLKRFGLSALRARGHAAAHGFAPLSVARLVLTKVCCSVGVPLLYVSKVMG